MLQTITNLKRHLNGAFCRKKQKKYTFPLAKVQIIVYKEIKIVLKMPNGGMRQEKSLR